MGSAYPPATSGTAEKPFDDHGAFVEVCIQTVERLDLQSLVANPPAVTSFMEAYVLARCLPVAMMRRPRTSDWRREERFDDEIYKVSQLGEAFLNRHRPLSLLEAALMLDAYDWDDEPNDSLWRIPELVKQFLVDPGVYDPLGETASSMLADFASIGRSLQSESASSPPGS